MPYFRLQARLWFKTKQLRVLVSAAISLVGLLFAEVAWAERVLSIDTIPDFNFGTWANAGSLSATTSVCAASWDTTGDKGLNYRTLIDNVFSATDYYLYLGGNTAATGNSRIKITFEHKDSFTSAWEVMSVDSFEQPQKGQPPNCPGGNNFQLRVNISSTELSSKLGGEYIGYFSPELKDGNLSATAPSFSVSISVGGVPEVKISHLDSINFGQHSGLGDISATETFCIYSSADNGAYRISISSTGQDAEGHYLVATASADKIPMAVSFVDNGTGPGTTALTDNFAYGNGDNSDTDCSGGDNAALTFDLQESDLQAASTGQYSEQITLLVEPE